MADLLAQVAMDGACIGCGLCAGASEGRVTMGFTPEMRERPLGVGEEDLLRTACPGLVVEGLSAEEAGPGARIDPLWGYWHRGAIGWAGDPATRHRASTGGVLSALAAYLIETGDVDFILHLGPDPDRPARSRWKISRTPEDAADTGGSRYGPGAPLAGLNAAKDLLASGAQRFAFIGKPCDVSAIRLMAVREAWLRRALAYRLTIMCGGASDFSKTLQLLADWEMEEGAVTELRYRGYGNPGPTVARTGDGREASTSYQALWEDESQWAIQHRCKICPDAIGMAADLVSFDCWPGGGPTGEDAGFNAILTRTSAGEALLDRAVAAGAIVLDREIGMAEVETFQPHQARKRRAIWARLAGQRAAGRIAPEARGLGVEALARQARWQDNLAQARGTRNRLNRGRGTEPQPVKGDTA